MRDVGKNAHHVYENLVTAIYQATLHPGDSFIDVGANIGHHTWQMGEAVGPTGRGFSVEPIPRLVEQIGRLLAIKKIDWVHVENIAVSNEPGEAEFFVRNDFTGWSSLFESHVHPDDVGETEVIHTKIDTLDNLLASHELGNVSCMKLDIEHSEFNALRGATETVRKHRPVIVFENSPHAAAEINEYAIEDFFAWFANLGYQLFTIFFEPFTLDLYNATDPDDLPIYYCALPTEHLALQGDPATYFSIDETVERLRS